MKKGFTLLELIIVVIIIGILAGLAMPRFFKVVEKAKSAEAPGQLDYIRGSQIRYKAEWGNYSTDSSALDIEYPNTTENPTKYFWYANATDDATKLGLACRSKNLNSRGYHYTVKIDENGTIITDFPNFNPGPGGYDSCP